MAVPLAIALAGLPIYVFPPSATIPEAGLAFVIGPAGDARMERAETLAEQGYADRILVSVSPYQAENRPGRLERCSEPEVVCAVPDPFTTKGEVSLLAQYTRDHDVDEVIVITFTPHVARARYIFDKCYTGQAEVTVMGVDEGLSLGDWAHQYAYQSAAFLKAWTTPCSELE